MTKRCFKDFYGCTASITKTPNGFTLRMCNQYSNLTFKRLYKTYRGARVAMGHMSDGWREI